MSKRKVFNKKGDMPVTLVEGPVAVFPTDFAEKAKRKGLGRDPLEYELEQRRKANGNMELEAEEVFLVEKYYTPVALGLYEAYRKRVLSEYEIVAVSPDFKRLSIEHNWGCEPTEEEILEKYPEGDIPDGYELLAVERDLVTTLGKWQKTIGHPIVNV